MVLHKMFFIMFMTNHDVGCLFVAQIIKRAFGHLARFASVHTDVFECGQGSLAEKTARRTAALTQARHELLAYARLAEQV